MAASCALADACGGAIDGRYRVAEVCIASPTALDAIESVCSGARVDTVAPDVRGGLTASGAMADLRLEATATLAITVPNVCHACRCTELGARLRSAGLATASCGSECLGGDCFCTASVTATETASGMLATAAGELTVGGETFGYCASADGATVASAGGAVRVRFVPDDSLLVERCDGVDNDHNGIADDAPRECPSCSSRGVCAASFSAACVSGRWACTYTDARWEAVEVTCDHLDNDCDGETDEAVHCGPEVCDGLDNDGDGVVDDDPGGAPASCPGGGVCDAGFTVVCAGTAGWTCAYSSPAWEMSETRCDDLDNDCDGAVDEPPPCCDPAVGTCEVEVITADLNFVGCELFAKRRYGATWLTSETIESSFCDGAGHGPRRRTTSSSTPASRTRPGSRRTGRFATRIAPRSRSSVEAAARATACSPALSARGWARASSPCAALRSTW